MPIEADLADRSDVAIFRHALGAQYAAEMGHGADDEADAAGDREVAVGEQDPRHRRLCVSPGNGTGQHGDGGTGEKEEATHEEISGRKV